MSGKAIRNRVVQDIKGIPMREQKNETITEIRKQKKTTCKMKQIKSFPDGIKVFTGDVVYVDNGNRKECVRMIEYRPYQDMYDGETYHTLDDINERWFRSDKTKHIQEYFPFSIDFFISQFNGNESYKIEHRNPSDTVVYLEGEPIIVVDSDADGKILKMKAVSNYGPRIPLAIINECIDKIRQ